jgi:hypothetical protein
MTVAISLIAAITVSVPTPALRVAETVGPVTLTTAAATTVVPTGRCSQWEATALDAGWDVSEWPHVDRIMWCESHCEPGAHNRSGASGLMQVMPGWWHGRDPYDPGTNLAMALEIRHAQGWPAWSCN